MKEISIRHLNWMMEDIIKYESGKIYFSELVDSLDILISSGEFTPDLEDNFLSKWGILEDTYSFMLYEERNVLNSEDIHLTSEALKNIKELILDTLNIKG
ncbi:MAG: hypothetical protein KF798_06640 [Candidatus Paracaedibacteraceae bacterium]|nr:hypothetical protein [Candidatus Paracaedibacteraceae bacterium]